MTRKASFSKTFTVIGTGEFPADMLRYDSATAATPHDQRIIDAAYENPDSAGVLWDGTRLRVNRVNLVTTDRHAPTVDRWRSFMWRVV
jgi:hypothetical protein